MTRRIVRRCDLNSLGEIILARCRSRTSKSLAGWALSAIIVVLALMNIIYWHHRLAAYRKDRQWEHTTYGLPFESSRAGLDRSKFTKDASAAYFAHIASLIVLYAAIAIAIWVWMSTPTATLPFGG